MTPDEKRASGDFLVNGQEMTAEQKQAFIDGELSLDELQTVFPQPERPRMTGSVFCQFGFEKRDIHDNGEVVYFTGDGSNGFIRDGNKVRFVGEAVAIKILVGISGTEKGYTPFQGYPSYSSSSGYSSFSSYSSYSSSSGYSSSSSFPSSSSSYSSSSFPSSGSYSIYSDNWAMPEFHIYRDGVRIGKQQSIAMADSYFYSGSINISGTTVDLDVTNPEYTFEWSDNDRLDSNIEPDDDAFITLEAIQVI